VKLQTHDEVMMVNDFEQIMAGPFSDSLIRNPIETFAKIRRQAVAYINAEEAVSVKHSSSYLRQTKPKERSRSRPLRVNETSTDKRTDSRRAPYPTGKSVPRAKAREDLAFQPKFWISYKELLTVPGVVEKLKFLQKFDRNLGQRKKAWCKFHKGFGHDVLRCITLGYQLAGSVKNGFLMEYLDEDQKEPKGEVAPRDQAYEIPVHGELNTISGGFSRGGSSASKHKRYARVVMTVATRRPDHPPESALCFTSSGLEDVVPHEDDPVVISIVTMGRKVHRVLINQGSSADVMFWSTFNNLTYPSTR